jgi:hypothetical protein
LLIMTMGTVFTLIELAAALLLAEVAVSCAYRIAAARWKSLPRWSDRVPDAGWLQPELSTGACAVLLTLLGVLPAILGAVLALAFFAVAFVPDVRIMWLAAKQGKALYAGRRITSRLFLLIRTAPSFPAEDLRALAGVLTGRRGAKLSPAAGSRPLHASPGVPPWRRAVPGVPSFRDDPLLGDVPAPADVATGLEAAGVIVPATWAAVAAEAADFEPETDEELCEHMDGEVAGVLTWAEGVMARAENLESGAGLDAAYVAAQFEFADDVAELAAHAAQVVKRYHVIYGDLREAADGKPLPNNRFWFGDGNAAPQGGQAA